MEAGQAVRREGGHAAHRSFAPLIRLVQRMHLTLCKEDAEQVLALHMAWKIWHWRQLAKTFVGSDAVVRSAQESSNRPASIP
jgi:hypothetical protein